MKGGKSKFYNPEELIW